MALDSLPIDTGDLLIHRSTEWRDDLRRAHLAPSAPLMQGLIAYVNLDESTRRRIHDHAFLLASAARRAASREGFALGLVHRFGLNTPQGIALMQLAEALPRTVDARSAHLLIADKIGSLSWRDAFGESTRFGQRMALHALDTLAKAFREARDDSSLQAFAHTCLQKAIAVLSNQYVLAETLPTAINSSRKHRRAGYRFSFDMLGEAAMTDAAALEFLQSYLQAIEYLAEHANGEHAMSVKLSALHPRFEERQRERCLPVLLERISAIAIRACAAQVPLTIDAEESDRLELTLDVFEHLIALPQLANWDGLGIAVQAYQRRALSVVDWLAALAQRHSKKITIRLVKGAYWDTEIKRAQQLGLHDYPIFVRKYETDVSYLACARRLLAHPALFLPQFATHNAHTVAAIVELGKQTANKEYEFQRLHGMGEHLHSELLRENHRSRIYAPIGPRRDLLPYLVRRLLENGASSSFVRQLTDTTFPLEQLVRDPVTVAVDKNAPPTIIGAPTDVRNQSWPAAQGLDLTARDTCAALMTLLHVGHSPSSAAPLIAGKPQVGTQQAVTNPANREDIVGHSISATEEHVLLAVATAQAGYATWSTTTAQARAAKLERAAQLLEQRTPEFIRLAVREAGKTIDDAIGEVREAADFCRYYAERCRLPAMHDRRSLGVVACISPWNFPLAIFVGQVTAALAAGNTVVAKPAEQTPLIAMLATRLLHEAGIPLDALQLLPGAGDIGAALVGHKDVASVCFTGSMTTAKAIAAVLARTGRAALPFIAETGGINAMVVDSSSLPEQVVRDVLTSAFQSAGQRCSALRLLCVQEEIADRILSLLRGALANVCVGDPSQLETDVGPLIDAEAQRHVRTYLAGKTLIAEAPVNPAQAARGCFVAPAIIEVARVSDVKQEVFGPVLHVMRFAASDLPAWLHEINLQGYGLTLGVHSRIRRRVQSIVNAANVGNLYVNRHQVGAVVGQQPFGGHGLSGTGPKAGGPHYLLRLSQSIASLHSLATDELSLTSQPIDSSVASLITRARQAQAHWQRNARYAEQIQFAGRLLSANTSQPTSLIVETLRLPSAADLRLQLPAIAGESNDLTLRPRGVLLCLCTLPDPISSLTAQILKCVATGNAVLAIVNSERAQPLRELIAFLQQSGAPDNLIACVEMPRGQLPIAWLTTLGIDGVVFDGSEADTQRIAAQLQERTGALLPLLSSVSDAYRFCLEQTVTINTAAAGGDPHLLGVAT